MRTLSYARPKRVDEAVKLLATEGAQVLAGGTDLLSLLKDDIEPAGLLVSVRDLAELSEVRMEGDGLFLGAGATLETLFQHELLRGPEYGGILDALGGVYSPQIRNMGTLGGDLLQRPRCWYYRAGFGLLPKSDNAPNTDMVSGGDSRYHSIFSTGQARFVSPSSLAPVLIALEATLELRSESGARTLKLAELFREPQTNGEREHAIRAGELLVGVRVPLPNQGLKTATYEVRPRQTLDWPLAAASAALSQARSGGAIQDATLVLGHVGPKPMIVSEAAALLQGTKPDRELLREVSKRALKGATPLPQNRYKIRIARTALERAISRALFGDA